MINCRRRVITNAREYSTYVNVTIFPFLLILNNKWRMKKWREKGYTSYFMRPVLAFMSEREERT